MGPRGPNPTKPRAKGATTGVRAMPAIAPMTIGMPSNKWVALNIKYSLKVKYSTTNC